MNHRSNRQMVKQPKLDSNSSPSPTPSPSLESLGITGRHSPILPKPTSIVVPVSEDFFPELQDKPSTVDLLLPEPIPPLPSSLSKVYNTRKRSHESASFPESESGEQSDQTQPQKPVIIPGFVSKLYRMVDESTSNLIKWGQDGKSFVVKNPEDFSRQVLPLFFKHNNFSSFVRQLNMYGFHKVPHLQQGSMAASLIGTTVSTIWEFSHTNFIRNRPDLLINVRRKIGKEDETNNNNSLNNTDLNENFTNGTLSKQISNSDEFLSTARSLRQELSFIHQQQTALRSDLVSLQRDNQLLWTENLASRERHLQQQQVIDRILRFLASVFTADGKLLQSSNTLSAAIHNSSTSRQRPLLLGNISGNEDELRRQVLELISGGSIGPYPGSSYDNSLDNNSDFSGISGFSSISNNNSISSGKIDLIPNENEFLTNYVNPPRPDSLEDLETTIKDISNDISLVDEEISNVLKTNNHIDALKSSESFDDVDFSSYLNCQSLE